MVCASTSKSTKRPVMQSERPRFRCCRARAEIGCVPKPLGRTRDTILRTSLMPCVARILFLTSPPGQKPKTVWIGQAHDKTRELRGQSNPQTGGGTLWLVQDGRRIEENTIQRNCSNAGIHFHGRSRVQPPSNEQAGAHLSGDVNPKAVG